MWHASRHSRAVVGGAVASLLGGALALMFVLFRPDATTGDAAASSGGRIVPPWGRQPAATALPARGPARTPASAARAAAAAPVAVAPEPADRTAAVLLGIPIGDAGAAPALFQDAGMPLPPWAGSGGVPAPAPISFPGGGGGGGGIPGPISPPSSDGTGGLPFWPVPFFPLPFPGDPVGGSGPIILLPGWGGLPVLPGAPALGLGPAPAVPEPSTWAMLAAGMAALWAGLRRRHRL